MRRIKDFVYTMAQRGLAQVGLRVEIDRPVRNPLKLMATKTADLGIRTIFDVGANVGTFGQEIRRLGYRGAIVSFEPLSAAHAQLTRTAAKDDLWYAAPRMAIGSEAGVSEINVARNLASSSLLQVERRSIDAAPVSEFIGRESVSVQRLDDVVKSTWLSPFAMKLDTQGSEIQVLQGAAITLDKTSLIMVEMSLVPLYRGGPTLVDVFQYLDQRGFYCISLTQSFPDNQRNELLQVDGVFARRPLTNEE